MKKSKISLLVVMVFCFSLFGTNTLAVGAPNPPIPIADDSILSEHIKEADGITGQDTNTGSGIKTGHIQDGAVSPAKIGFYSNVIIVAPSGGDFTSPVDAMNAITDASATNPYLVKIMPGVYNIGSSSVQMKPYVDIEGSGENSTKIKGNISAWYSGVVTGVSNSEIRFLTLENVADGALSFGIFNPFVGASPKITNITIIVSGGTVNNAGIYNGGDSAMTNVTVVASGGTYCEGIHNSGGNPVMNNVIATCSDGTYNKGIYNEGTLTRPLIMTHIKATALNGTYNYGIYNAIGIAELNNVTISTSGGISENVGIYNYQGTVRVDHSVIKASTATIINYTFPPQVVMFFMWATQGLMGARRLTSGAERSYVQAFMTRTTYFIQIAVHNSN